MSEPLKPCPFCGGVAQANDVDGTFFVVCSMCSSVGRTEEDAESSIDAWNRRSAIPLPVVERKCGNCRYLQWDAGQDGTGWCVRYPEPFRKSAANTCGEWAAKEES